MSQKTVEQILKSDPFYSPDINVDLSSFPSMSPVKEESFIDDRFAPLSTTQRSLRDVLVARAAAGEDTEINSVLAKAGVRPEQVPIFHLADGQEIVPTRRGDKWIAECTDSEGQTLEFEADDWHTLLVQMNRVVAVPLWGDLSAADKLTCQRMIASGAGLMSAIETFILRSLTPESLRRIKGNPADILTGPFLPLANLATRSVFEWATDGFRPSPEWDAVVAELAAEKPLTISLLAEQWRLFKNDQQLQTDRRILRQAERELAADSPDHDDEPVSSPQQPQAAESLEDLDDQQIADLTSSTLRTFARKRLAERRGGAIIA